MIIVYYVLRTAYFNYAIQNTQYEIRSVKYAVHTACIQPPFWNNRMPI